MILIFIIIIILPLRLQWVLSKMIIISSFMFYNDIRTIMIIIMITIKNMIMMIKIVIIMILININKIL